jgi:hypothetical protein
MSPRTPRRAQRYKVHWEVKTLNGKPVTGIILLDISATGARLEASQPLAPRYPVTFSFFLPNAEAETCLSGSVIWMRPLITPPGRYQMGVKFHEFKGELDQLLRQTHQKPIW